MTTIEAIIFDCDGVLVDSEVIFIEEEIALLGEMGLHYARSAYIHRFMGLNNTDWIDGLTRDFAAAGLGEFPSDFLQRKRARTWPRIESELQPIAGGRDLIAAFDGPVAAASSSDLGKLVFKLEKTGLHASLEPHIYSAEQVQRGKPAPDLFLFAAQKIGAEPATCLVIEDSENGVRAGLAAGMHVFGFTGGGHASLELQRQLLKAGAHQVFDSFEEIAKTLGL